MLDLENPFIFVNTFLKEAVTKKGSKEKINLQLIYSILSQHIPDFYLTQAEFYDLMKIKPVRLELPIVDKDGFLIFCACGGKYSRGGNKGVAGVYVFTNKSNGYSYVGSSISLANRLSTGYFKPILGKRKIDLAITSGGLNSFHLDLYILPSDLFQNSTNVVGKLKTSLFSSKVKQLTLALEQIFLLANNPEYNNLKVAGSPAGLKRTLESMINNFIVNSKPLYMYDTINQ
jgi:GIY-YIG catalytic domain